MTEKKQTSTKYFGKNADYLYEILKDISFIQKVFIHVHVMTLDLDVKKIAVKTDRKNSYCHGAYILIQEGR